MMRLPDRKRRVLTAAAVCSRTSTGRASNGACTPKKLAIADRAIMTSHERTTTAAREEPPSAEPIGWTDHGKIQHHWVNRQREQAHAWEASWRSSASWTFDLRRTGFRSSSCADSPSLARQLDERAAPDTVGAALGFPPTRR